MIYGKRILACLLGWILLFGAASQYHLPVCAQDITVAPMIDIGNEFVVALASDGTAWSWGQNDAGQLGIGTISGTNQTLPTEVTTEVRFQSVSAGDAHVLALATDGTVWAWGENGSGQLGDESTVDQSTPVAVHGLSNVTVREVVAGGNTSFLLTEDRKVYAWGANTSGMLGDTSLTADEALSIPTQIAALDGVRIEHLFAGEGSVAAIASDGSVWLWGESSNMQCGTAQKQDVYTPTKKVPEATDDIEEYQARTVALGKNHTAILSANDVILNVGLNAKGQFGNGKISTATSSTYYLLESNCTVVTAMHDVVAMEAGSEHMLAMTKDGTIYAWGNNSVGQLAVDPSEETYLHTPQAISLASYTNGTVVAVAAGYNNSAVIDSEGHVFMWGSDSAGQLGNGASADDQYTPNAVLGKSGEGSLYLGLSGEDITHQVYVTANATIPSPTFSVTIPATLDFGTLEQKTATEENRISTVAFTVSATDIQYLFGKTIVVQVSPASGEDFALIGAKSGTLPYKVYNVSEGGEPLAVDAVFATFTTSGSVSGRLVIDKSTIEVADTYTGTLNFRVSTVEASGS